MLMILRRIISHEDSNLASDPCHDKHMVDWFMYSFVYSQENEFANHLVER
jgi:hypothetical protein